MYLLSLSTLALLKCLLSLSFSPLSVFPMDAYMCVFGGGLDLRFSAQSLGQAICMYICVQSTRVSYTHNLHVYTYACIHMYHVYAEGLGFADQGSGPDLHMHVCTHVHVCVCMYIGVFM